MKFTTADHFAARIWAAGNRTFSRGIPVELPDSDHDASARTARNGPARVERRARPLGGSGAISLQSGR